MESCAVSSWTRRRSLDPAKATPIAGATVVLNLRVVVHPNGLDDTASTTITQVGQVVTDAQGRFMVTSIPEGDYFLVATPAAGSQYYGNSTWTFVSSGNTQADAVIYLPRKLGTPPPTDSLPPGPVPRRRRRRHRRLTRCRRTH